MDLTSGRNDARTDRDQSDLGVNSRVSFESRIYGLYVIRIPNGPCKIGRTRDLPARLAKMQTHHPYDLEVALWSPGRGHEEIVWHHCFDDFRIRGEWFHWGRAIARAVTIAKEGGDWTEVAKAPPELLAEYSAAGESIDPARADDLYRDLLKRWANEKALGGKSLWLPRRANSPVPPKSPGPIRRVPAIQAEIDRLNAPKLTFRSA